MELLARGEHARHYGATNMNERSSRSHTIFELMIETATTADTYADADAVAAHAAGACDDGPVISWSTLMLVDLAGSERISKTGTAAGTAGGCWPRRLTSGLGRP